jgi:uncharacterized protein (TIGR02217 family)
MAVTTDTSPLFPKCPTYQFQVEPRFLVKSTQREGGYERRDLKWEYPLHVFTAVPMGNQQHRDIYEVKNFYMIVQGRFRSFRFKDWSDYKSCNIDDEVAATDQPLVVVNGSPGGYQLTKRYTFGSGAGLLTQDRPITKPKGDTIIVANEVGATQATSTYTVEEATGLIVPNGSFVGTPTAWGGEFYVPVRFDSELSIQLTNYKVQSAQFGLAEVRYET